MPGERDREHLERRYRQCLESAEKAAFPHLASIHRELAARCAQRLAKLDREAAASEPERDC